jgi:hypothetical protein
MDTIKPLFTATAKADPTLGLIHLTNVIANQGALPIKIRDSIAFLGYCQSQIGRSKKAATDF